MALLLSLKVFLISTCVLFTALVLMNVSVPLIKHFFATHVPLTWNFCLLCFKPPYLILLINAIIIAIAASSKFHHSHHPTPPLPFKAPPPPVKEEEDPPAPVDVKTTWTLPEREESTETPLPPTLEDVWKVITEGRVMALKKSETFKVKGWRDFPMVSATTLRKEPSLSQDELNQRVEAFLKKFNEETMLQKQESLNGWMKIG